MHTNRSSEYLIIYKIDGSVLGSELFGLKYSQPYDFFENLCPNNFFRLVSAGFASESCGTALVHCAPTFGEEDYKAFVANCSIKQYDEVPFPVDEKGKFTSTKCKGTFIKDPDKITLLYIQNLVLSDGGIVRSCPCCWRSDMPITNRLVPNWFIHVSEHYEELLHFDEDFN